MRYRALAVAVMAAQMPLGLMEGVVVAQRAFCYPAAVVQSSAGQTVAVKK